MNLRFTLLLFFVLSEIHLMLCAQTLSGLGVVEVRVEKGILEEFDDTWSYWYADRRVAQAFDKKNRKMYNCKSVEDRWRTKDLTKRDGIKLRDELLVPFLRKSGLGDLMKYYTVFITIDYDGTGRVLRTRLRTKKSMFRTIPHEKIMQLLHISDTFKFTPIDGKASSYVSVWMRLPTNNRSGKGEK